MVNTNFIKILGTLLIISLIITRYIMLISKIIKYLIYEIIRRYLYFIYFEKSFWYPSTFFFGFPCKVILVGPFSI